MLTFIKRLISGVLLLIFAGLSIYFGGIVLWAACFAVGLIGAKEICDVMDLDRRQKIVPYVGTIVYYLLISPFCIPEMLRPLEWAAALAGLIVMGAHVILYPGFELGKQIFSYFMIVYPGIMSSCVYLVRRFPNGELLAYLIMAASWGSDTFAYVAGMTLGRLGDHHPFPVLSPKKSVEGCIGGVLGAAAVGALLANYMGMSVGKATVLTALAAIAGELGDLAASSIKRKYGKKDYGNLIAGHGGVMDRFDSTLFSGAFIFCIVAAALWLQ